MIRPIPMLRLTPQAAGALQQQCTKATTELREMTRYQKEFDRQLKEMIGHDTLRKRHKDTNNALLLADLAKEAA
jgi:flagellar biosynthesis chaperone FliJ